MDYTIKDLRDLTGLSQNEFAKRYQIPVSTLRKWEQGETKPAKYFVALLARTLPGADSNLIRIEGDNAEYFYDKAKGYVYDSLGNYIKIEQDLEEVKAPNLKIYLEDLFMSFYEMQEKFNRDCRMDKDEDIIWVRGKS